ncbi:phage minor capsid protein [uncultured Enterococcus sp.]|uniref:phage minor capsid protein n=1 Tax=uncultured Enterococcus sp. TaxID=167972 RepID=UPI0025878FD8|nr:phage minor capsid protein [uncultured Enterococcus sp.]
MAITQRQLDIKSAAIQDSYLTLEEEIMQLVVDRLKIKTNAELSKDTVFQWYLEKLDQLGLLNWETINELVEETNGVTKNELADIVTKEGYKKNLQENKKLANLAKTPVKEWTNLDQILNQYFESQWLDFENHINQTLLSTNYQVNSIAKMYQQVLNDTVARIIGGLVTPQKAFRRAIYEMVQKGIDVSLKDKSGKSWTLEAYVRTVIKSTTGTVFNDLRLERGINEYGIVTALMSHHPAARDACSKIQGKYVLMVPKAQAPAEYRHLPSVYDYGWKTPAGCNGINCNHRWYSQLPMEDTGMTDPVNPEIAQQNAKIVAKQRRLERSIRMAKKSLKASEWLGDQEDIEHFKSIVRARQAVLRQFIEDNKTLLHRSYDREQVYS